MLKVHKNKISLASPYVLDLSDRKGDEVPEAKGAKGRFEEPQDDLVSLEIFSRKEEDADARPVSPYFSKTQKVVKNRFQKESAIHRLSHILAWLLISGVLMVPVVTVWGYRTFSSTKGQILGASTQAVNELRVARDLFRNLEFQKAGYHFVEAHKNFFAIDKALAMFQGAGAFILRKAPKGESYYHLSKTGLYISEAGSFLSHIENKSEDFTAWLTSAQILLKEARPRIHSAHRESRLVALSDFSLETREDIAELQDGLALVSQEIDPAIELVDTLLILLGKERWQRYLLLFQNSGELRPTGGFIGTFAIADVLEGKSKKVFMPAGGTYDLHYGMSKRILSPEPFRIFHPLWEIQDCNWFPDFRYSANRCARFFEESSGTSVDGVIAFTVGFMVDLLDRVGPIAMPEYDVLITAENFVPFTQALVEESKHTGKPKQFLVDLFPRIVERVLADIQSEQSLVGIGEYLLAALQNKDVMLYSYHESLQGWLLKNNWTGAIGDPDFPHEDYLSVNTATLNGGKSDFMIHDEIRYSRFDDASDKRIAQTEIIRTHEGVRLSADLSIDQKERDYNYLTSFPNVSYLRLYVPKGARLLNVTGDVFDPSILELPDFSEEGATEDVELRDIERFPYIHEPTRTRITEEFGKTVFGQYILTNPGGTSHLVFTYELPTPVDALPQDAYRIFIQKQPGTKRAIRIISNGQLLYDGAFVSDMRLP